MHICASTLVSEVSMILSVYFGSRLAPAAAAQLHLVVLVCLSGFFINHPCPPRGATKVTVTNGGLVLCQFWLFFFFLVGLDVLVLGRWGEDHDDDVFYLFLHKQKKNRSQAPYIPLGRYVP